MSKWEDLETDCLVKVFEKIGLTSLILEVPSVCMSWYRASLVPNCWKILDFRKLEDELFDFDEENIWRYAKRKSMTEIIKYGVDRSCGAAVEVVLPSCTSIEDLDYIAERCPMLKFLSIQQLDSCHRKHFSEIIGKWKDLEILHFGSVDNLFGSADNWFGSDGSCFKETLSEISVNCNNLVCLGVTGDIGYEEVMGIVGLLPNIKDLIMRGSELDRENLLKLLDGCKQLQYLDVRDCLGFWGDDEEILNVASRIKTFRSEGAVLYEEDEQDEHINSRDCDFTGWLSD